MVISISYRFQVAELGTHTIFFPPEGRFEVIILFIEGPLLPWFSNVSKESLSSRTRTRRSTRLCLQENR